VLETGQALDGHKVGEEQRDGVTYRSRLLSVTPLDAVSALLVRGSFTNLDAFAKTGVTKVVIETIVRFMPLGRLSLRPTACVCLIGDECRKP
jgi:hypothetical protein